MNHIIICTSNSVVTDDNVCLKFKTVFIIIIFSPSVVKIPRVKSSKKLKSKAGVWLGIWIVLGLMGNERVSKQNGVEVLCGSAQDLCIIIIIFFFFFFFFFF